MPFTVQAGLELIFPNELSLAAFFTASIRDSPNKPHDYQVVNFLGRGADYKIVSEQLSLAVLTVGKTWWLSKHSVTRLNLKGGPLLGTFSTPENFIKGGALYSNYTYDRNKYFTTGLTFQPCLLFAVGRGLGFNLGAMAIINKYRNIYGVTVGISFGKLRSK